MRPRLGAAEEYSRPVVPSEPLDASMRPRLGAAEERTFAAKEAGLDVLLQ